MVNSFLSGYQRRFKRKLSIRHSRGRLRLVIHRGLWRRIHHGFPASTRGERRFKGRSGMTAEAGLLHLVQFAVAIRMLRFEVRQ